MKYVLLFLMMFVTNPAWAQMNALLDARAKTAPTFESREDLVQYLISGLENDQSKARVIAAWIVYQVQRNGYRRKELIKYSNQNRAAPAPPENDPFQTRIGTPTEFANLFQSLGEMAGLTVETIEGYAGRDIQAFRYQDPAFQAAEVMLDYWQGTAYPLQRYQAAWNAVQINDTWHLLDTYWMIANDDLFAAQDITSDRAMQRLLAQRAKRLPSRTTLERGKRIDDTYFFAKPRIFIQTHFPLDSQWQLLPTPKTWATFIGH